MMITLETFWKCKVKVVFPCSLFLLLSSLTIIGILSFTHWKSWDLSTVSLFFLKLDNFMFLEAFSSLPLTHFPVVWECQIAAISAESTRPLNWAFIHTFNICCLASSCVPICPVAALSLKSLTCRSLSEPLSWRSGDLLQDHPIPRCVTTLEEKPGNLRGMTSLSLPWYCHWKICLVVFQLLISVPLCDKTQTLVLP